METLVLMVCGAGILVGFYFFLVGAKTPYDYSDELSPEQPSRQLSILGLLLIIASTVLALLVIT
jgi:hypothetical protein